jgi:ABC-type amino acid transport substrate-binding protein
MAFATAAQAQTYVVGINPGIFGLADPDTGEVTGYSADLMNAIAADAGFEIEFVLMSFGDMIPALVAGEIDINAASTTITPERAALGIAFSDVYLRFADAIEVAATDNTPYTSIRDFAGLTVCGGNGTIYTDYMNNLQATEGLFLQVLVLGSSAAREALASGTCAAYMGTDNSYPSAVRRGGDLSAVRQVETYQPVMFSDAGISVREADTGLLATINGSLARLVADGTVAALAAEWNVLPPLPAN